MASGGGVKAGGGRGSGVNLKPDDIHTYQRKTPEIGIIKGVSGY
jgi:hypothetical protein